MEAYMSTTQGLPSTETSDKEDKFFTRIKDAPFKTLNLTSGNTILIPSKDKNEEIIIDDDDLWYQHFSTEVSNEEGQRKFRYHINDRYEYKHEHKYDGKNIAGKIAEQIAEEISNCKHNNTVEYVGIKESRKKGKIQPSVRIVLSSPNNSISLFDFLNDDTCKKYGVKGITLLLPCEDKYERRGIRCCIDDNKTRIYEVANGSYEMDLTWSIDDKECKIKVGVSDNGSVELLENITGVTGKQIAAHKEIKVGRQYEAKFLYEALSYLELENSEVPSVLSKHSFETIRLISENNTVTNELVEKIVEIKPSIMTSNSSTKS